MHQLDDTNHKMVVAEIQKLNAELWAANAALVQEIAERKLVETELLKARYAADAANSAKSAFLANMSHEIRTPLNGIIGLNYLVQQTKMTLQQSEYMFKINTSAHRLLGILNDILDFSKVEAGKIELEHIEFNLEEVFSQLDLTASLQAREKGLELKISVAEDTPMVLVGDPLRLGQVLLNLTSNAIKFTERGKVEVSVALLEKDDAHVALKFKVHDTGMGLSPQQLEKLFQPFCQSDASTSRCFGGTGLGLAICKRFVQLMGGVLDVQSAPMVGSAFTFSARFEIATSERKSSGYHGLLSGQRALIIDDGIDSRKEMTRLLSQLFITSEGMDSCADASREIMRLSSAGAQGYDLVLVTCSTRGKNTLDNVKLMRQECAASGMPPMILVAECEMAEMQVQLNEAGFCGFLIKPLKRSSLFDVVVRCLAQKYGPGKDSNKARSFPSLHGARILVVEDNEINQEIAVDILKMVNCEAVVASNGADALELLHSASNDATFAAVLMDLQMPGLDGFATTQLIRADERYNTIPVIAMTADAISGVKEQCLKAGMNDYLTKPVIPQKLFATLKEWVRV